MDLLAYWHVHHSTSEARHLLSQPGTYEDMLQAGLVNRGTDPADVIPPPEQPTRKAAVREKPTPVTVVGKRSKAAVSLAQAAQPAMMVRDWAKRQGKPVDEILAFLNRAD